MKRLQPEEVKSRLEARLPGAQVFVEDLTGTHNHYKVTVISPAFADKPLLARHQIVNAALAEELKGPIHALSIEAYTETQWQDRSPSGQRAASKLEGEIS